MTEIRTRLRASDSISNSLRENNFKEYFEITSIDHRVISCGTNKTVVHN